MDFTNTAMAQALVRASDRRVIRTAVVADVPDANTLLVDVDNIRVTVICMAGTYADGDTVMVIRDGQNWYALGRVGPTAQPAPVEAEPEAKPPKPPEIVSKTFLPQSTGTRRGSGWRSDTTNLYQGDYTGSGRNFGAAFYGTGPSALSGTIQQVKVVLRRLSGGSFAAQTPTLRLLGEKFRPGGTPSLQGTVAGPSLKIGQTVTTVLPSSWGTLLMNGGAGGIGIWVDADSPYVQLAGRVSYAAAFALTITYQRS